MKKLLVIIMLGLALISLLLCYIRANVACTNNSIDSKSSQTIIKHKPFECFEGICKRTQKD